MGEIKELSSELSDQIAAGEVIERPSSVVKELLENSIDAGSSQIRITFIEAGLREIVIEDNGSGIAANQIDLAFQRHATSKIKTKADLFKIQTLGFRGEALASISAVAHVNILTNDGGVEGVSATFTDGKKLAQKPAAAKQGTRITVQDLFYNTPARLKYLKSEKTEVTKIIDIVNRIALSHPDLKIALSNEKKNLLLTNGNGNLRQVMAHIYGRNVASEMLEFTGSDADFEITGLLTPPSVTRTNRNYISILLNGRYIKNYQLNKAIMFGYGTNISLGKYPILVLNIRMDPLLVDVNVHPTKQEVRMSKEPSLSRLISSTITAALSQQMSSGDALENLKNPTDTTSYDQLLFNLNKSRAEDFSRDEPVTIEQNESEIHEHQGMLQDQYNAERSAEFSNVKTDPEYSQISHTWAENTKSQAKLAPFKADSSKLSDNSIVSSVNQVLQAGFPALRYIGQLTSGFLVADSNSGFYLVDYKEAWARLRYNKLAAEFDNLNFTQQLLLTPVVLELNNVDYERVLENIDLFQIIGLEFADFGRNSLIMKTHPSWIPAGHEQEFAQMVLDLYHNNLQMTATEFKENVLLLIIQQFSKSEKKSKKMQFNDRTGQNLLDDLEKADSPYQSPNGKPILAYFSERDLAKMFKHVQKIKRFEI